MTEDEWQKAKNTFPWKHRVLQNGLGGIVQVIDKNGAEVPLFTLVAVTERLTHHIATSKPSGKQEGAE